MSSRTLSKQWRVLTHTLVGLAGIPFGLYVASALWYSLHKTNPFGRSSAELLWAWATALNTHLATGEFDGNKILWAGVIAFVAVYFIPIHVLFSGWRKNRIKLHGDAKFATKREIGKAKLNGDQGIVIGKSDGEILRFPGQQFVMLAAPTRSGKGVGVVIPNLLSYEGSCVVLDIKQENYELTSGYRQNVLGQKVFLFNPFADECELGEDGLPCHDKPSPRTFCYNLLSPITGGVFRVGDILGIANAFWPSGGKDAFWNDSARNLFLAIVLFLLELRDRREETGDESLPVYPVTMGEVLRQSSGRGTGKPVKKYFASLVKDYEWLSEECKDSMANFLSASEDVLSSILSTFTAPLTIWRNPIVDASTSESSFDLADVRKEKITIYVGVKPKFLDDSKVLLNVFFSQLVNLNTRELPQDNPTVLKHQCLLLLDEFTSIGKVNVIAKAVSYIAGYNLRLLPIIQSVSQLESVYGKEDARTFITNHAMQIIFAPREQKDANEYSEMLGTYTLKNASVSRSREVLGSKGPSESVSDQKRALLMPQELKEIGQWKEVIFLENTKPVLADKIRYFDDPVFSKRVLPPPEIPVLNIRLIQARNEGVSREVSVDDLCEGQIKNAAFLELLSEADVPQSTGDLEDEMVLANIMAPDQINAYAELVAATERLAPSEAAERELNRYFSFAALEQAAPIAVMEGAVEFTSRDTAAIWGSAQKRGSSKSTS